MSDLKLVWVDLEMTGLDPETCVILEAGVMITGDDLAPIEEMERVIWQPDDVLARMEPFVRQMHTDNGLLERVRASTITLRTVEREVQQMIAKHCAPQKGVLAGSSIHTDRTFLARHMPLVERFLHYRQVDVSSLKTLVQAWYPHVAAFEKPGANHTALADLRFITVWQAVDEFHGISHLCRAYKFLFPGVGISIEQVFPQCRAEEGRLLQNYADLSTQRFESEIADVVAIDLHAAGGHVKEARYQAHHG
jgi:oligoribonuclease